MYTNYRKATVKEPAVCTWPTRKQMRDPSANMAILLMGLEGLISTQIPLLCMEFLKTALCFSSLHFKAGASIHQ